MAKLTVVEAINLALKQEMEKDPRALILGEDVGKNGGVFRVTQGLLDIFGEARVMDTPLSELAIAGVAIGMAIYGLRPIAEIQFEGFGRRGDGAACRSCWSDQNSVPEDAIIARWSSGFPTVGAFARRSIIRTATKLILSIPRESKSSFPPLPTKPRGF